MAGRLRVVTYNILEGGIGRADPIAEVILAQRPDVVCLVEADDAVVRERIAWRLGFDHVAAAGRGGRTSCLMARGTILTSANLARDEGTPRSLLACEVGLDGVEVGFAVAHFTGGQADEREARREGEADGLLAAAAAWRDAGTPHVLAGDFNSVVPDDEVGEVPPKSRAAYEANGHQLPRRTMAKLLGAGYVDAAPGAATFTTQHPRLRIDHVLVSGLAVVSSRVEHDRLAKAASDHFPTVAELEVA